MHNRVKTRILIALGEYGPTSMEFLAEKTGYKEKTVLSVLNSQEKVYKYFNKDCIRGPRNFYFFKNTD